MRYVVNNLEENEASESADVFIMLSVENDRFFPEQEAVGVAQEIGSVCSSNQGLRSAIVEYLFDNDLIAGYITAHEIGHLLGMSHDFDQEYYNENRQRNPRNDSNGNPCVGGVMDYYPFLLVTSWSKCSVEDFTSYYSDNQPFCLNVHGELKLFGSLKMRPCNAQAQIIILFQTIP